LIRHTDIAIPPRHLAAVCRLFGCAAEDALDAVCALEMNKDADLRAASFRGWGWWCAMIDYGFDHIPVLP